MGRRSIGGSETANKKKIWNMLLYIWELKGKGYISKYEKYKVIRKVYKDLKKQNG